ncbi:MAG: hypothetical protein Q9176_006151 [Flavoplaca citrina]
MTRFESLSRNVCDKRNMTILHRTLLLIKSVEELFERTIIRVEVLAGRQLVHAFTSQPHEGQEHLQWANRSPLEIDENFYSPVSINRNVVRMGINEIVKEGPIKKAAGRIAWEESSHYG